MDIRGCARMNCCCVPCNISPSRPRDQCGSVRYFTIGADKTRWFLGTGDAGFREGSPNDVVDGGMSSVRIAGGLGGLNPLPHLADPPTSDQNSTRGSSFNPPT